MEGEREGGREGGSLPWRHRPRPTRFEHCRRRGRRSYRGTPLSGGASGLREGGREGGVGKDVKRGEIRETTSPFLVVLVEGLSSSLFLASSLFLPPSPPPSLPLYLTQSWDPLPLFRFLFPCHPPLLLCKTCPRAQARGQRRERGREGGRKNGREEQYW